VRDLVEKVQISSLQVHPDGNLLAVGCADGSVKLWNISANEMLTSLEDDLKVI
jgi:WD40 repeat protein